MREADDEAGRMLADDADSTTGIRNPGWQKRILGGDTPLQSLGKTVPDTRNQQVRMPTSMMALVAQHAKADDMPKEAWMRHQIAAALAERTGRTVDDILDGMLPKRRRNLT